MLKPHIHTWLFPSMISLSLFRAVRSWTAVRGSWLPRGVSDFRRPSGNKCTENVSNVQNVRKDQWTCNSKIFTPPHAYCQFNRSHSPLSKKWSHTNSWSDGSPKVKKTTAAIVSCFQTVSSFVNTRSMKQPKTQLQTKTKGGTWWYNAAVASLRMCSGNKWSLNNYIVTCCRTGVFNWWTAVQIWTQ